MNLSDEEIVKRIQSQINVAVALRVMARFCQRFYGVHSFSSYAEQRVRHLNKMAGLFTAHALKLIAVHKEAVTRWMEAQRAKET